MSYNPINPFSKLTAFPSITSVFDKLGSISDTGKQTSDTDTDSKLEITAADPHTEQMDTFVNNSSTTTATVSPEGTTTLESFVASTIDQGYFDSQAFQSTDMSMDIDIVLGTRNNISHGLFPLNLEIDEDAQSDDACEAQQSDSSHHCSETYAASQISSAGSFSGNHNNTAVSNSAGQSSKYIRSEDLLSDSQDLNSQIVEMESIHSIHLEETADSQPIASMVESEGYYTPAQESQSSSGCLPNTQLFASAEERPGSLSIQSPKKITITDMMSSSEHYCASTFVHLDNTVQSDFKVQHLSTSGGYITNCS